MLRSNVTVMTCSDATVMTCSNVTGMTGAGGRGGGAGAAPERRPDHEKYYRRF